MGKKKRGVPGARFATDPTKRVYARPCDTVMDGRTDKWTDGASPMDTLWTVLRRTFERRLLVIRFSRDTENYFDRASHDRDV